VRKTHWESDWLAANRRRRLKSLVPLEWTAEYYKSYPREMERQPSRCTYRGHYASHFPLKRMTPRNTTGISFRAVDLGTVRRTPFHPYEICIHYVRTVDEIQVHLSSDESS